MSRATRASANGAFSARLKKLMAQPRQSEIANGKITSTGGDSIASLVINGTNVTAGGTLATATGTLVIALSGGAYSYSYTLNDNTSGDATTKTALTLR